MRLDKYLKVSRIIKRRTVANEACDAQKVIVNGKPARASYDVKIGDVIEITLGQRPVMVKVLSLNEYANKETACDNYESTDALPHLSAVAGRYFSLKSVRLWNTSVFHK